MAVLPARSAGFAPWQEKSAKTKLVSKFANDDAHRAKSLHLRACSLRVLDRHGALVPQ